MVHQLPALTDPGLAERFVELQQVTTAHRGDPAKAVTQSAPSDAVGDASAAYLKGLRWLTGQGAPRALAAPKHTGDTYAPTTIAALGAMADEQLRNTSTALTEGVRQALTGMVWEGELQDPAEIARSIRWVALQRAL